MWRHVIGCGTARFLQDCCSLRLLELSEVQTDMKSCTFSLLASIAGTRSCFGFVATISATRWITSFWTLCATSPGRRISVTQIENDQVAKPPDRTA
jgi:hypothetical protein